MALNSIGFGSSRFHSERDVSSSSSKVQRRPSNVRNQLRGLQRDVASPNDDLASSVLVPAQSPLVLRFLGCSPCDWTPTNIFPRKTVSPKTNTHPSKPIGSLKWTYSFK